MSPPGGASSKAPHHWISRERTAFEWALLLVSAVAIGTIVIGLLIYSGNQAGGEAKLVADIARAGTYRDGPQFEITVRNTGGSGAEQVVAEVSLGPHSRLVTMLRIPKDDEASAIVTFPAGSAGDPELQLLSYNQP